MKNILLEQKDGVATITINRPKSLNALNSETLNELRDLVLKIEEDDTVRAVILTGSGEKAFVAGADISEMVSLDSVEGYEFGKVGQRVFDLIEHSKKPYIAAVNGFALGGGCELALSCDIRIASTNAKFAIPEVTLGVIPGFGGTQRLTKTVGLGKAKEMLVTGAMIDSEEAEKWGLVNKVVDQADLIDSCYEITDKIVKNSAYAIASGLQAMNLAREVKQDDGLEMEGLLFGKTFGYPDQKEGMTAFLEKRRADFK